MRKKWIEGEPGITLIAVGLAATMLSLAVFAVQDMMILIKGKFIGWSPLRDGWYVTCAGIAAIFSTFTAFIWRSGFPKILATLLSVSMASYVLERFVSIPTLWLRPVASCRVLLAMTIALLLWRFSSTTSD
jgi:hypothetical protein